MRHIMRTIELADLDLSPRIILGAKEHHQLTVLALSGNEHTAHDTDWLLHELERASVVSDTAVPPDVVRMNSTVLFRTIGGDERSVQLVFPNRADIAAGRVSVLTPVGSALIGLRAGHSITWLTRDGRKQLLTVLAVSAPTGPEDPGPPLAA